MFSVVVGLLAASCGHSGHLAPDRAQAGGAWVSYVDTLEMQPALRKAVAAARFIETTPGHPVLACLGAPRGEGVLVGLKGYRWSGTGYQMIEYVLVDVASNGRDAEVVFRAPLSAVYAPPPSLRSRTRGYELTAQVCDVGPGVILYRLRRASPADLQAMREDSVEVPSPGIYRFSEDSGRVGLVQVRRSPPPQIEALCRASNELP